MGKADERGDAAQPTEDVRRVEKLRWRVHKTSGGEQESSQRRDVASDVPTVGEKRFRGDENMRVKAGTGA